MSVVNKSTSFNKAFENELCEIARLRALSDRSAPCSSAPDLKNNLVGLSLSGGGIRSASFCIGVLQNLADRKILGQIDIISAVSGGCYALGNLMATAKSEKDIGGLSYDRTEPNLYAHQSKVGKPETVPTRHLRNRCSYLISDKRTYRYALPWLFAANVATNFLILLPCVWLLSIIWFFLFGDVTTKLASFYFNEVPAPTSIFLKTNFAVTRLLLTLSGWFFLVLVFIRAVFSNFQNGLGKVLWRWGGLWTAFLFIVFLFELTSSMVYGTVVFLDFDVKLTDNKNYQNIIAYLTVVILIISGVITSAYVMLRKITSKQIAKPLGSWCVGLLGPIIIWGLIIITSRWLISTKSLPSFLKKPTNIIASVTDGWIAATRDFFALSHSTFVQLFYGLVDRFSDYGIYEPAIMQLGADRAAILMLLSFISLLLLAVLYITVKANHTSLHRFYKSRLGDTFLDIRDSSDKHVSSHTFEKLSTFRDLNIPICLINVSANSTKFGGIDKFRKSRRFVISPWTCGFDEDYIDTKLMESLDKDFDIGAAVAISGAAASAHMGELTRRHFVVLLSLLNIRLGYWCVNPKAISRLKGRFAWSRLSKFRAGPLYYLREMFSFMPDDTRYINISDGGHSDNLGVLALIQRKCKLIIAVDSEEDSENRYTGLANVVRCARRDHNIDIEISTKSIAAENSTSNGSLHYAIGNIHYSDSEKGTIIYLKSSLTGDENEYISAYKATNPSFPHESTVNQFFTEVQFEVYRALGFHASNSCFSAIEVKKSLGRIYTDSQKF